MESLVKSIPTSVPTSVPELEKNVQDNWNNNPFHQTAFIINYLLAAFFLVTAFLKFGNPHFDYGQVLLGHKERHPYGGIVFFGIAAILITISTTFLLVTN